MTTTGLSAREIKERGLRPAVSPAPEAPLEPPLELRPEIAWVDYSSISNPMGTPPAMLEALTAAMKGNYLQFTPDRDAHALRSALSSIFDLPVDAFLCGTSVTELIRTIAQTYQPCRVGLSLPCRQEYALALGYAGHTIVDIAGVAGFFTPDPPATGAERDFDAALLANPGYPSSRLLSQTTLLRYLQHCKWVIVDERSIELSFAGESMVPLTQTYRNLIVVRSLVETYALDGAPVSYCVAHPDTITQLNMFFDSSGLSMVGEILAPCLADATSYLEKTHETLDQEIPWMQWMLNLMPGIKIYPAEANYILCELVTDGRLNLAVADADELATKMQRLDFGLHTLNGFPGLPDHKFFTVSIKTHEDNERFVKALRTSLVGHEAN